MASRTQPQTPDGLVALDLRCYAREAVMQAAAVFSGRADFFIEAEGRTTLELSVRPREEISADQSRQLIGDFLNEALNQDLRLSVVKSRQDLLRLLTAQVLSAAAGDASLTPVDAKSERSLRQQARELMAQCGSGDSSKKKRGGSQ